MTTTLDQAKTTTTFGHAMLSAWQLDPAVTYLNHGTVGVTPRAVLEEQQRLRDQIEAQPSRFLLRELSQAVVVGEPTGKPARLRVAASRVADFVGASADDLVFVDNATTGANGVLRSFPFESGDTLAITDLGYGGVNKTAEFVARDRDITLQTIKIPPPVKTPQTVVDTIEQALEPSARVLIADHICSDSALLLPVQEIAALCHQRNVLLLVDGAHAPGSIPLDIPSLGADWYVGNLHKWAWAPRSCGILWAAPERQSDLHPAVISWGLDQGMSAEFDMVGTRDPTPFLAAPFALDLLEQYGVAAMQRYNHDLVWQAAHLLAARWGTHFVTPREMVATMATIPLPESFGSSLQDANRLRDALLFEDSIEVQVGASHGGLQLRIAAQIYNEMCDFERLGEVVVQRMS